MVARWAWSVPWTALSAAAGEGFSFCSLPSEVPWRFGDYLPTQGSKGGQHYILFRNGHGQGFGSGFLCGQSIGRLRRACFSGMAKLQLYESLLLPSLLWSVEPRDQPVEDWLSRETPPPECLVIVKTRSH